ncbi:class I SAM-dependent methyltransferase [Rhizobium sp. 'Codium 1']|uniref:class I SAM-dependent methyltransferase n=1 Tax=Rhizobium sp. 'Codium 1' TaxID=2940484 RepID=UPI001E3FA43F|nr:class I SAM-dependent methyltransferase [Rhizobium sp. 'Codium 1']MCC8933787.1 class I SAM-dependent methyltransferase [Rhizobium sp. 'Codium 1']
MSDLEIAFDGQSLITPDSIAAKVFATSSKVSDKQVAEARTEMALHLRMAEQQFEQKTPVGQIMLRLLTGLHGLRNRYSLNVWEQLIPLAQTHAIARHFHEDPFTRWSFEKPRGYSGDAGLLDFIYGHPSVQSMLDAASPMGKEVHAFTSQSPACAAVRERRDLLAQFVDDVASSRGGEAEILTIAAGHLREGSMSQALRDKTIKRWLALDQDPLSVGAVASEFAGTAVEAVNGSVRTVLTRAQTLGTFDFIYAAGLYDYLADEVAIKLSQRCLQMLKPNGTFLFANFSQEVPDDGYMETFMNWALLLRSEEDMWRIMRGATQGLDVECSLRFGQNKNIVYGIIRKLS